MFWVFDTSRNCIFDKTIKKYLINSIPQVQLNSRLIIYKNHI